MTLTAFAQPGPLFYRSDFPVSPDSGVIVADLNNDGWPDFAVASQLGNISVGLGNGDGTFQPLASFAPALNGATIHPRAMAAADLDGDGHIDLVLLSGSGIVLLPGNGDGSFGAGRLIASYTVPVTSEVNGLVEIADLNHDGRPDLVIPVGVGLSMGSPKSNVTVLLNNGNGSFSSHIAFEVPTNQVAIGVAIADFNRDGSPDLAVIAYAIPSFPPVTVVGNSPPVTVVGFLYVGLGKGDGSFSSPLPAIALDQDPNFIAAADFNNDGVPDLAIESGRTMILLGNGDGSFRRAPDVSLGGSNPGWIAIADFDHDGKLDLAIWSAAPDGVGLLAGNGNGTFHSAGTALLYFPDYINQIAAADLNGDGLPDMVVAAMNPGVPGAVSVFLNADAFPAQPFIAASAANELTAVAPASLSSIFFNPPLPGDLSGANIRVRDSAGVARQASLFYVSPTQINLEIPAGTAPGVAAVAIDNSNGPLLTGSAFVQNVAPAIFTSRDSRYPAAFAITYGPDNQPQPPLLVTACPTNGPCAPVPIPRPAGSRVFLELFATGIRNAVSPVMCLVDGQSIPVAYAGPQGGFDGLDQVNIEITNLSVSGTNPSPPVLQFDLALSVDGRVSDPVIFHVQ